MIYVKARPCSRSHLVIPASFRDTLIEGKKHSKSSDPSYVLVLYLHFVFPTSFRDFLIEGRKHSKRNDPSTVQRFLDLSVQKGSSALM